ncbi:L-gulonolactone/D-arabinono-1,4-lactone oxidase [Cristinia sonorae]|uniref:D-arabinono-1,4-lactone oxidase n=1 Tax=Cristinia sonorae TaxID=1940300 RepID=A0A8K0XQQ4_9AGAR|nr:L-gulonolactone/D-arabinono-1,4-lactone oxidase [Cristinia sonorae]
MILCLTMPSTADPPLPAIPTSTLWDRLAPTIVPSSSPNATFINWGLSYTCKPLVLFEPRTEYECELVLELARREGQPVRAAGVGHSPSDLACTSGYMMRTSRLAEILEINSEKGYVLAQGGITLNALHAALATHNLAMINVGSISDQTLAGVVTTATHGSGLNYQNISTHVLSLLLLLADGTRARCSRHEQPDLYWASLCGLGSTGIILQVQLQVCPAFRLKDTQETVPLDKVLSNFDAIVQSSEHSRLWWFPQADVVRVSLVDRTLEPKNPPTTWLWHSLLGYHLIQFLFFLGRFLPFLNAWTCRYSVWLDRASSVAVDDSWRIFNVDCKYPQFTTEWAIPYENTTACLRDIRRWLDSEQSDPHGLRPHFPIEVRFSDGDDIWLSPSHGQKTTWIGLIQYKPYGLNVPYRKLFEHFEDLVSRHGGRPHWAKAHRLRPDDLRKHYPRFDAFVRVLETVDPNGMFRNPYVDRHIFGKEGEKYGERVFKALP